MPNSNDAPGGEHFRGGSSIYGYASRMNIYGATVSKPARCREKLARVSIMHPRLERHVSFPESFMRSTLSAIITLYALSGSALAEQESPPPSKVISYPSAADISQEFDRADTNRNGLLEKNEWLKTLPKKVTPHADLVWSRIQPSGAGSVSKDRFIQVYTMVE